MDSAKIYWLRYLPLEEMPNIASIIAESYRNNLITENEALSGMCNVEDSITDWVKENNKLNRKSKKKFDK